MANRWSQVYVIVLGLDRGWGQYNDFCLLFDTSAFIRDRRSTMKCNKVVGWVIVIPMYILLYCKVHVGLTMRKI